MLFGEVSVTWRSFGRTRQATEIGEDVCMEACQQEQRRRADAGAGVDDTVRRQREDTTMPTRAPRRAAPLTAIHCATLLHAERRNTQVSRWMRQFVGGNRAGRRAMRLCMCM